MADHDQEKLEFERERWRDELTLRRAEQELKRQELTRSGWRSPLVIAIAAAALAAVGNGTISYLDGRQQRALEAQRAEAQVALEDRRAEAARILEMIKSGDPAVVRNNLGFLIEAGLVENERLSERLASYLAETPDDRIPRLPQQIEPGIAGARRLHVLAVGISNYADKGVPDLAAPTGDAAAVIAAAALQRGALYSSVSTTLLIDADATRAGLIEALAQLGASLSREDVVVIHFSGHAAVDREEFYLVAHDAPPNDWLKGSISVAELGELLSPLTASAYVVLTVDACPGGNHPAPEAAFSQRGMSVVMAALPGQVCLDEAIEGRGALTQALVEALSGQGDRDRDGAVTVSELVDHLLGRVSEITEGKQVPAAKRGLDGVILQARAVQTELTNGGRTDIGSGASTAESGKEHGGSP